MYSWVSFTFCEFGPSEGTHTPVRESARSTIIGFIPAASYFPMFCSRFPLLTTRMARTFALSKSHTSAFAASRLAATPAPMPTVLDGALHWGAVGKDCAKTGLREERKKREKKARNPSKIARGPNGCIMHLS